MQLPCNFVLEHALCIRSRRSSSSISCPCYERLIRISLRKKACLDLSHFLSAYEHQTFFPAALHKSLNTFSSCVIRGCTKDARETKREVEMFASSTRRTSLLLFSSLNGRRARTENNTRGCANCSFGRINRENISRGTFCGWRERERESIFALGRKVLYFFVKMINILWWEYKRVRIEESNFLIIFYPIYQSRRSNRLIN